MRYLCFDTAINGNFTLVLLQQEYPVQQCLFQDTKDASIWDSAPWLFEAADHVYEKIDHPLASLKHVLFFETAESLDALRQHLQYFIYKTEKEKEYFFRFWDARVMQKYLKRSSEKELESFFGDVIDAIYLEDPESDGFISLTIGKKGKIELARVDRKNFLPGVTGKPMEQMKDPFTAKVDDKKEDRPGNRDGKSKRKFFMD